MMKTTLNIKMINIYNFELKRVFPKKVDAVVLLKFCRDGQFDQVLNRIEELYPGSDKKFFVKTPFRENAYSNFVYNQQRVDDDLMAPELLTYLRGADLLISVVSHEFQGLGSYPENTANIHRFLRKVDHENSFFVDSNLNVHEEKGWMEDANHHVPVLSDLTAREQDFLYNTAKSSPLSGDIVEIGRATAGSTCILASGIRDAKRKEKVLSYDLNLSKRCR